jgi:flagellin-like hook-associated protein FlgL
VVNSQEQQLTSSIERLSAVLMQTQIERGRIYDADAASEASRLANQQILSGVASQMISMASAQKLGLIELLV